MPRLLYRYILSDLLRVGLLTTAVLVTVIAFGAAIKPLANEALLSASQTIKYIALAIVPMMQFALPFAFGFAATVVFQRMTAENEILAICANGISYRRILFPVAALGLILTVIMGVLTQSLIPKFWALMQHTVRADATELFQAAISRGVPFKFDDAQIYADRLRIEASPPDTGAESRFILYNVAAAVLDREGRVERSMTAGQAVADIHRVGGRQLLKLVLVDAVGFDPARGVLAGNETAQLPHALEIPQVFDDDPVFMSFAELRRLRERPDSYFKVQRAMRRLALALREQGAWRQIHDQLRAHRQITLTDNLGRQYVVIADAIHEGVIITNGEKPVEILRYDDDALVQQFTVAELPIRQMRDAELKNEPLFEADVRSGPLPQVLKNLRVPGLPHIDWDRLTSEQLLRNAHAMRSGEVNRQLNALENELLDLQNEIISHLHRRYALCVMAPLLLLLGSVLAMWLRTQLPLTIFFWAFVPAVLSIMLLAGGGQMIKDGDNLAGLSVLWSGSGVLLGLLGFVTRSLMRN